MVSCTNYKRSMKRIALLIIALVGFVCSEAQVVQSYEFELSAGFSGPLGGYRNGTPKSGAAIGLSLRHNIEYTPWDCGVFLNLDCAQRDFLKDGSAYYQNNRTLSIGVSGSYNFRQGSKINPFAGLGIGVAFNDVVDNRLYPTEGKSCAFIPKIGVEFMRFIRLNAYTQISRKGYNTYGISIGIVIGGLPKKY